MVRKLRILCARIELSVWRAISRRFKESPDYGQAAFSLVGTPLNHSWFLGLTDGANVSKMHFQPEGGRF
jgi:hypothetical protein